MSDPTEPNQAEPHPASSHRTPREIAKDEAGPIGGTPNHPTQVFLLRMDQCVRL